MHPERIDQDHERLFEDDLARTAEAAARIEVITKQVAELKPKLDALGKEIDELQAAKRKAESAAEKSRSTYLQALENALACARRLAEQPADKERLEWVRAFKPSRLGTMFGKGKENVAKFDEAQKALDKAMRAYVYESNFGVGAGFDVAPPDDEVLQALGIAQRSAAERSHDSPSAGARLAEMQAEYDRMAAINNGYVREYDELKKRIGF